MSLILFGLSHKTAPAALRERLSFPASTQAQALGALRAQAGLSEAVLLSTCNRMEIYAYCEKASPDAALRAVQSFLAGWHGIDEQDFLASSYQAQDAGVAQHLFMVVSSLDSMVVGEQQILGQVRQAYWQASRCDATGPVLNRLFHRAIRLGKDVRSTTTLGRSHLSVATVALDQAKEAFGSLAGRKVLVVGAGEMAELAVRYLLQEGAQPPVLANRSVKHAQAVAGRLGGSAVGLEALEGQLGLADIVISSTASDTYLVEKQLLQRVMKARAGRKLLILDIAIPRDIDPACADVQGVELLDMDALSSISQRNRNQRLEASASVLSLIDESLDDYMRQMAESAVLPSVKALRFYADEVVEGELKKLMKHLGPVSEAQRASIEAAMNAVANKLLHHPLKSMREGAGEFNAPEVSHVLGHAFCLEEAELFTNNPFRLEADASATETKEA